MIHFIFHLSKWFLNPSGKEFPQAPQLQDFPEYNERYEKFKAALYQHESNVKDFRAQLVLVREQDWEKLKQIAYATFFGPSDFEDWQPLPDHNYEAEVQGEVQEYADGSKEFHIGQSSKEPEQNLEKLHKLLINYSSDWELCKLLKQGYVDADRIASLEAELLRTKILSGELCNQLTRYKTIVEHLHARVPKFEKGGPEFPEFTNCSHPGECVLPNCNCNK